MSHRDAQIREAIESLIQLLRALESEDSQEHDLGGDHANGYSSETDTKHGLSGGRWIDVDYGCVIKPLPNRMIVRAAEKAVDINPVNGVMEAPMMRGNIGISEVPDEPLRTALMVQKYWGPTPRRLTVSFLDSPPAELRRRIITHMNAWTRTGCIEFVETTGVGEVRIARGRGGYYSYLGTDILLVPRNRPTLNLQGFTMRTPESEFRRVVRHEAGHTLGFVHEHMRRELIARLDREKTYNYFQRTQGWSRQMVDTQVLTPLDEKSIFRTPPDQDSIMCYHLPGSITVDGRPIRGGEDINQTDYRFCGYVYPRPGAAARMTFEEGDSDDWDASEDPIESRHW